MLRRLLDAVRRHYGFPSVANSLLDGEGYSSAVSFQGWTKRFQVPQEHEPLPVSPPTTWLLKRGWARHGAIDPLLGGDA